MDGCQRVWSASSTRLSRAAVVGVDIDDEPVGDKMLMVSASGTAAKLGGPGPGGRRL
ncbi:MAG TPA: heavy metal-binding domain-containing protein [Actinomycetes bacterium]|nr:heavy metal-binding domain-containing protein [Actinomycetes bacterium]